MGLLQTKDIAPVLAAALGLLGAGQAHAGYTSYFGEDANNSATTALTSTPNADAARGAFLSKLQNAGTETFESQTTGTGAPLTLSFPGSNAGQLPATLSGGNGVVAAVPAGQQTDGNGRYSVPSPSTLKYWEVAAGAVNAPNTFTVDFGQQPIAAFGFYGIDIGDFGGQLQLVLFDEAVEAATLTVPNSQGSGGSSDGSVLFYGFIADGAADQFTSVRFQMANFDGDVDVFAFDNFTIAELSQVGPPPDTVPEPGTLTLLAGALLGLGLATRRRA